VRTSCTFRLADQQIAALGSTNVGWLVSSTTGVPRDMIATRPVPCRIVLNSPAPASAPAFPIIRMSYRRVDSNASTLPPLIDSASEPSRSIRKMSEAASARNTSAWPTTFISGTPSPPIAPFAARSSLSFMLPSPLVMPWYSNRQLPW
jgi:hypothetical protein